MSSLMPRARTGAIAGWVIVAACLACGKNPAQPSQATCSTINLAVTGSNAVVSTDAVTINPAVTFVGPGPVSINWGDGTTSTNIVSGVATSHSYPRSDIDQTLTVTVTNAQVTPACTRTLVVDVPKRAPAPAPTCVNTTGDPNTASPPTCLNFAGFEWVVKRSNRFDPGPNAWSDSPESVWVDALGYLHLTIKNRNGTWFATEVVLNQSLGYGTYTFDISGPVAQIDRNAVLGLFTYDYLDPAFAHREIDIEYSLSLGFTPGANGHFTVQPFQTPGNTFDFVFSGGATHSFDWSSNRVTFQSGLQSWVYTGGSVPQPGRENVRMNLWLFNGSPPTNGAEIEIVITGFQFR